MNLDVATFKAFLPAFKSANDTTVQLYLDESAACVDAEVLGDRYTQAVFYRAAHMLALDPSGQAAKLVLKFGTTTYWVHYLQLCKESAAGGYRVCD